MHDFRKLCLLLCAVCLVNALSLPARADGVLNLASEAAVLMDAQTGQVLYEKNMHQKMYPASITKVMTGMLALQNLAPDTLLTTSYAAVQAVPRTSSHISLEPGETMTLDMGMHALAMESANDAANVLGEAVSGSLEAFGEKMTQTAQALGAQNTHFANANGLPDSNHYTTAYDMALIVAAAIQVPGFTDYFSTVNYTFPGTNVHSPRNFVNKNRILPGGQYAYEGVLMSKTGWTTAAQGTLVTAATQGETTLVAVVMKSVMLEDKYRDTTKLFDYGFSQFSHVTVTGEQIAAQLPTGVYSPMANQTASFLVPAGTQAEDLTFSLGDGMTLEGASADQTAVTIHVQLGPETLPGTSLIFLRPGVEPSFPEEELALAAELEEAEEAERIPYTEIGIAAGLFVIYVILRILYIRRRERRHRKRRLEGRIRMMHKLSQPDD